MSHDHEVRHSNATYFPFWAFTSQHQIGAPRWLFKIMIVAAIKIGPVLKRSSEHPKPQLLQSNKWVKSLMGWHQAYHIQPLLNPNDSLLWTSFSCLKFTFQQSMHRNRLIGMHTLYITRTNDSVKCHRQHVIDLMPLAKKSLQKQAVRFW